MPLPDQESVAHYYDTAIFEAELARLTRDSPVERAITERWLDRPVPGGAEVAEIAWARHLFGIPGTPGLPSVLGGCIGEAAGDRRGSSAGRRHGRFHRRHHP